SDTFLLEIRLVFRAITKSANSNVAEAWKAVSELRYNLGPEGTRSFRTRHRGLWMRHFLSMARIVIENLTKIFRGARGEEICAIKNLSLIVKNRELLVLAGPSGAGKSTTLRMIAGLEDISTGSIAIDDKVVNDVPPQDRDIAMVFQNCALYPHMTAFENMAFGLKLRKLPKPEIYIRVRETAEILGLTPCLDRKPS